MVRQYGHGGDWINRGLPHYIVMDKKPDNGLEIQNEACDDTGVMVWLKLVKELKTTEGQMTHLMGLKY